MTTMKKIFSMRKIKFLLATIMMLVGITAQAATKTVTWDSSIISTLVQNKTYTDANGITVSGDDALTKNWRGVSMFSFENYDGVDNVVFSLSNGNFTSIVINCSDISIEDASLDNGFTQNGNSVTWSGNANTITLKAISDYGFISFFPTSIVFTIEVDDVNVSGVSLSQTEASMTVGETLTLTPTVLPANATDKSVTWTSSDASVATVTDGVVTAVAAGTATITVTTTDGAKTATCTVTVAEPTYTVTVKEGTEDAANWTITPTSAKAGETVTIKYKGTKKVKSVKAVKK